MPHMSEKTWYTVSDEVSRKLEKLVQFIVENESLYDELLELWDYHGNVDQAVADQLFEGPATAEQVAMAADMRAAMVAAHNVHETADLSAIRKLT